MREMVSPRSFRSTAWLAAALCLWLPLSCPAQFATPHSSEQDPAQKPITLAEANVSLEELVRKASGSSGVRMTVDSRESAWAIRELRVAAFAYGIPVSHFQAQIAKLLDLKWTKSGDDSAPLYTLRQDAAALARQQQALKTLKEKPLADVRSDYAGLREKVSRAARMSPDELQKAYQDDPWLQLAVADEFGKAYVGIVELASGLAASVSPYNMDGTVVGMPISELPLKQQHIVHDFHAQMRAFAERVAPGHAPEQSDVDWSKATLNFTTRGVDGPDIEGAFAGMFEVQAPGMHDSEFPVFSTTGEVGKTFARAILRVNAGEDPQIIEQEMQQFFEDYQQRAKLGQLSGEGDIPAAGSASPGERPAVLDREIDFSAGEEGQPREMLDNIARQAPLFVFSEVWPFGDGGMPPLVGKTKLATALGAFSRGLKLGSELDGSVLRLKSKDWASLRAGMVPVKDIDAWRKRARERNGLPLDDLAYIAKHYTLEQIEGGFAGVHELQGIGMLRDPRIRAALLFYGELPASTLRAAEGGGIPVLSLGRAAQDRLADMLSMYGRDPRVFLAPGSGLTIEARRATGETDGPLVTTLKITADEQNVAEATLISLPLPPGMQRTESKAEAEEQITLEDPK